jgi:solute carrier family 45 protein 1/2/4
LVLIPNGVFFGRAFGENYDDVPSLIALNGSNLTSLYWARNVVNELSVDADDSSTTALPAAVQRIRHSHFWGIFFTVLGTVLVDFCSDAAQSPSRTFMIDVTLPGIIC